MKSEISKRIDEVIKKAGGQTAISEKTGIPLKSISNYCLGISPPKLEPLIQIAKATNVSLDWLATGEGAREKDSLDEMTKNIRIDADLMAELVKIVNEYLDSLDRELPPEKLGKVYAYLYNYCHKDEPVSRDSIISLIDLAG